MTKTALSIAGSDSSGGAGIQADLKTFSAHGVYGMTAITAVTAQNTMEVCAVYNLPDEFVRRQIESVYDDIVPDAVKIGMVSNADNVRVIADTLKQRGGKNIVLDPVMVATSGGLLIAEEAVDTLIKELIPLADIVTPNIPEARKLTGATDIREMARLIHGRGCRAVLIKGGHGHGDAVDVLFDGTDFREYQSPRINTKHTHGTGCTLSSAIAANLALGLPVNEAVNKAKEYITAAIARAPGFGRGNGPIHHFYIVGQF
jgi:hydroxymethylpyrimidine/phosphomethylpyrimidine kinase